MREEIKNWWKQAEADLITAKNSYKSRDYYASIFWCQQSVEKALKAIYNLIKEESPGPTHSLIFLASEIKLNKKFFSFLRELTPAYISTRYPDMADASPTEIYDEEMAKRFISKSEELLEWLKKEYQTKIQ